MAAENYTASRTQGRAVRVLCVLTICLLWSGPAPGTVAAGRAPGVRRLSADLRVERGLVLLYPRSHSVVLQEWELGGIPSYGRVTTERRLSLAIREFTIALRQKHELKAYSESQVNSQLGHAHIQLAQELQRRRDSLPVGKTAAGGREISKHFAQGIRFHRRSFYKERGELKYTFASNLVKAIVASGDLNSALTTIRDLEEVGRPSNYGDHALVRLKADIYLFTGREHEAGLIYEEWIRRGNVDVYFNAGNLLTEKLRSLQKKTGHPTNIP